jgi:hypothetical protein
VFLTAISVLAVPLVFGLDRQPAAASGPSPVVDGAPVEQHEQLDRKPAD